MRVELDIWRQNGPDAKGHFEHHVVEDAEPEWSLLELLDRLNDQIVENDGDPIVFESDCREGVCGCCGFMVNGKPHGPLPNTPACRQHLRAFPHITHFKIEPFRRIHGFQARLTDSDSRRCTTGTTCPQKQIRQRFECVHDPLVSWLCLLRRKGQVVTATALTP